MDTMNNSNEAMCSVNNHGDERDHNNMCEYNRSTSEEYIARIYHKNISQQYITTTSSHYHNNIIHYHNTPSHNATTKTNTHRQKPESLRKQGGDEGRSLLTHLRNDPVEGLRILMVHGPQALLDVLANGGRQLRPHHKRPNQRSDHGLHETLEELATIGVHVEDGFINGLGVGHVARRGQILQHLHEQVLLRRVHHILQNAIHRSCGGIHGETCLHMRHDARSHVSFPTLHGVKNALDHGIQRRRHLLDETVGTDVRWGRVGSTSRSNDTTRRAPPRSGP